MSEAADPFDLERFVAAQASAYADALRELQRGRKQSHWMWFIFPQVAGLAPSAMARRYAIRSRAEAQAYLRHPLLGPRLLECTEALLRHDGLSAEAILGSIDAIKLRSSMTLFLEAAQAGAGAEQFSRCLARFFGGEPDPATLRLLAVG